MTPALVAGPFAGPIVGAFACYPGRAAFSLSAPM